MRSTTMRKPSGSTSSSRRGFSTTAVAADIRAAVAESRRRCRPASRCGSCATPGVRVANSVRGVEETLLEGAALTVLVVFLFLNSWRSTVITGLALPVSVLASFIVVWMFGFTLNTMSLLGLSLAIGVLIDDAIVVRENIVRHVEMGKGHYRAAFEGTDEIGLAVTATTMSIVVVFLPVAFISGIAGQWFKPFALTIACSVLVSLFVSFSLDPMLSAYWPDPPTPLEQRPWLSRVLGRFNHWFDRRAEGYKGVVAWALDHRPAMIGLALSTFIGAARAAVLRFPWRRVYTGDGRIGIHHQSRDAAGIESRLHQAQGAGSVAGVARTSRRCSIPTAPSAGRATRLMKGPSSSSSRPRATGPAARPRS